MCVCCAIRHSCNRIIIGCGTGGSVKQNIFSLMYVLVELVYLKCSLYCKLVSATVSVQINWAIVNNMLMWKLQTQQHCEKLYCELNENIQVLYKADDSIKDLIIIVFFKRRDFIVISSCQKWYMTEPVFLRLQAKVVSVQIWLLCNNHTTPIHSKCNLMALRSRHYKSIKKNPANAPWASIRRQ